MCCTISANRLLPHQLQINRGLFNPFSGQKATPEQASDMLTFRQIGTKAVQQYVTYHILQQPSSAHVPVRQHKLLTMSNVKSSQVLVITQLRVPYTRYGTVVTYKARVPQARVLYVTTVPYMVYGHEQLCNN